MNNVLILSSVILWIVVLFNLLLTVALIRRGGVKQPEFDFENVETLEIGSQAPDFTAETIDGKTVTLADYAKKAVAFIFVSPTCQPCLDKLPELHKLAPQAQLSGVDLVLINTTDKDETEGFVKKQNITLPILIAPRATSAFMDSYKAMGTPFYCFVNKQGKIQATGYFDANWNNLIKGWVTT